MIMAQRPPKRAREGARPPQSAKDVGRSLLTIPVWLRRYLRERQLPLFSEGNDG